MAWQAAVIAGAASIGGALIGNKGASDSAKAYKEAAEDAAQVQQEMYYTSRGDLAPYRDLGENAIDRLLGTGPTYAATSEQTTNLMTERSALATKIRDLETKGVPRVTRQRKPPTRFQIDMYGSARDVPLSVRGTERITTYKPAPPGELARLKSQLADLDKKLGASRAGEGEIVSEGTTGLIDLYPEALPYPDLPDAPVISDAPKRPDYPTLEERPAFDYGEGAPIDNALVSFRQDAFKESPGYQWQVDQAQKATERMAAARGYRLSPRAISEFSDQAQGLASQDYENWLGNQFKKADLALNSWQQGRVADIQDWLMPYQMDVADWERQAGVDIQNWSNDRGAKLNDWSNQNQTASSDWMNQYNALMGLLNSGQSAASGSAAQNQNYANSLSQIDLSAGLMEADKYINQANNTANAITSGANNLLTSYYSNQTNPATTKPKPTTTIYDGYR